MTDLESQLGEFLRQAAPNDGRVSAEVAIRSGRRRQRAAVGGAVGSGLLIIVSVGLVLSVVPKGLHTSTLPPTATSAEPSRAAVTASLPPGSVRPSGCLEVLKSLPSDAPNAAGRPPAREDQPISELQAICIAERGATDGDLTHPAWAWLTSRADVARYGWDGCVCNERSRSVWVISVAGPTRTEGGPGSAPRDLFGYSFILDATSGQVTDAAIGLVQLRGGKTADLSRP